MQYAAAVVIVAVRSGFASPAHVLDEHMHTAESDSATEGKELRPNRKFGISKINKLLFENTYRIASELVE